MAPLGWLFPSRFYLHRDIYPRQRRRSTRHHGVPRLHVSGAHAHLGNAISVVAAAVLFAAFHAPGRCHTLGMVYRYRCSVWFTAPGIAYDGGGVHACDMQFDSLPLCQAVIALCRIAGGDQFQNKISESKGESAHGVSLASEEHSARLMNAFNEVSAQVGGKARHCEIRPIVSEN